MKKILAMLAALMLLAVPVMGSALTLQEATQGLWNAEAITADFTMEAGDIEHAIINFLGDGANNESVAEGIANIVPAVKELIAALGVHAETTTDLQNGKFALMLSGQEALDIAWTMDETQAAVQSSWIGEAPLAFGWDELREMTQSGSGMDFDFNAYINGIKEYAQNLINNAGSRDMNGLNILPKTAEYVNGILEKAEKAPAEQPGDCDPVAEAWTINLTRADIQGVVDAFLGDAAELPILAPVLNAAGMDAETFIAKVDESLQQGLAKVVEPVVINVLVDAESKPVKVECLLETADEENPLALSFLMSRNTMDGTLKTYDILFEAYQKAELQTQMSALVTVGENSFQMETIVNVPDGDKLATMMKQSVESAWTETENTVTVQNTQVTQQWQPSYEMVTAEDGTNDYRLVYPEEPSLVIRTEGSTVIEQTADGYTVAADNKFILPQFGEDALLTVHGAMKTVPAPAPLNTENAVHFLKLGEEEQTAFIQNLMTNVQTKAIQLVQLLPQSVLMLVMQMMPQMQ